MLKPITITPESLHQPGEQATGAEAVKNVFKVFHGFYGNLFLSKFATGSLAGPSELDASGRSIAGQDLGVIGAQGIWGHGLREFDLSTIKTALARTMAAHPEFPPTLPQFVALCKACAIRPTYKPETPAIGMSQPLRSSYAARSRQIVEKHREKAAAKAFEAAKAAPVGLDALKQAIADATATAGGDEAAQLLRLDMMLAPRVAARGAAA